MKSSYIMIAVSAVAIVFISLNDSEKPTSSASKVSSSGTSSTNLVVQDNSVSTNALKISGLLRSARTSPVSVRAKSILSDGPPMLDTAFAVSAKLLDMNSVIVDFKIHPETYLYAEKINFISTTHSIKTTETSKGKIKNDEFFGKIEVHKDLASATITFSEMISSPVNITVGYQGCWEGGVCYPPQKTNFSLNPENKK